MTNELPTSGTGDAGEQSARRRRPWRYVVGLLCGLLVAGALWRWYQEGQLQIDCRDRLNRTFHSLIIARSGGYISAEQLSESAAKLPEDEHYKLHCPESGRPYVYRPVQTAIPKDAARQRSWRLIAWCPTHCHREGRNVLIEGGGAFYVSEQTFQRVILNGFVAYGYQLFGPSVRDPPPGAYSEEDDEARRAYEDD